MEQTYVHSTFPNQSCFFTLCQAGFCTIGLPTNVHFCHLLEKGFATIYSSDSPQILCKGSVITLFYNCLKLLFNHGDLLCEMFPSMQGSYQLDLLKSEEKQNKMLPLISCMQIFISSELELT